MTAQIRTIGAWAQTRETLVQDLSMALSVLQDAAFSDDPASDYARAQATEKKVLEALRRHAVIGLKEIDDAIAAGPLVAQIGDLSRAAKREADRIAAITRTIDDVAGAVTMVVDVVTRFTALAAQ